VLLLCIGIFGCGAFLITIGPWLVYTILTAIEALIATEGDFKVSEPTDNVDGLEEVLVGSGDKEAMRPTRRAIRRGIVSGGEKMRPMKRVTNVKEKRK